MYVIAAVTFFNMYITEKILIVYYHQKPPMYDDKLNNTSIKILNWAPVFMMFFGYWCLGNRQVFNTKVIPAIYSRDPVITSHTAMPDVGPSLPLLIMGCVFLIYQIFSEKILGCIYKKEEKIEVDEELGSYFDCVTPWDRKKWLAAEVYRQ